MTLARRARCAATASIGLLAIAGASTEALGADPTMSDCLTANEASSNLQAEKKFLRAREKAVVCAAEACNVQVHDTCRARVEALNHAIPTIVFQAKDSSGVDLTAVSVSMDGEPLVGRLEGTSISVDPGTHSFHLDAAGQLPIDKTLVLVEGQKDRVESIVFSPIASPAASSSSPPIAAPPLTSGPPPIALSATPPPPPPAAEGSTQRAVGFAVGALGVVGVAIGGIFGALSISAHSSYEKNCGSNIGTPDGMCNALGVSGEQTAANRGTLSTIFFVGGGAAFAAGAVLYFTAPRASSAPQVGAGPGSLWLRGSF